MKGGVSQTPGAPPSLTHAEPQLRKGAGPRAHSARGISGGGVGARVARPRAVPEQWDLGGGRAPQIYVLILLSFPPLQEQSLGRGGEGSASRESKDGGKSRPGSASPSQGLPVRNCFAAPSSRCSSPSASRSWLWRSLQFANWGGGVVANQGRPLPCKPEGSLRCTRHRAGRAGPGSARPPPLGPFLQATLGSLPSFS